MKKGSYFMKLSIAMMVKNQSKHLDECLKSLQPVREKIDSELIIVDTGSEDDTVDIAKRYTDKVYFHEWTGNFAEMRNISISYTKGEWVFIIDGDEVIENADPLIDFFKKGIYKNYNAAVITVRSFSNDKYDAYYDACLPRLFKKTAQFKYEGAIHEQPVVSLPVCRINLMLLHYGYITTDNKLMEYKFKRNVEMLKKELDRDPENIYYWFQMSQSYGMHRDFKDAMEAIDIAYNLLKQKGKDLNDYYYVLHHMVYVYNLNGKYKETEKLCHEAIKVKDGYIDIYYHLGKAQMNLGKYDEAVKSFSAYLSMLECPEKFTGKNDATLTHYTLQAYEEIYRDMVLLYEALENYSEALSYAEKINDKSFLVSAFPGIIKSYIKDNRITGLKDYFDNVVKGKFPELENDFIISLENIKYKEFSSEIQHKLTEAFAAGDGNYALLNKIRLHEDKDDLASSLVDSIKGWDFAALPAAYGDILYYLMKRNISIHPFFDRLMEKYLIGCIEYISVLHKDAAAVIYDYIANVMSHAESLEELSIKRALERCALLIGGLDEKQYSDVFSKYIKDGTEFINNLYKREIIENEAVHLVKTEEDAFLIYMILAEQNKEKSPLKYVQYLRKALKVYPAMKKGIELLLDDIKKEEGSEEKNLNEYKRIFKENIKKQVESGEIALSLTLINEYKKLVGEDVDIYSIEAVIAMMEGRLDDAESLLNKGMNIDGANFDILYNLAYVYMLKEDKSKAFVYYSKAYEVSKDSNLKDEIAAILDQIKNEKGFDEILYETEMAGQDNEKDPGSMLNKYKREVKISIQSMIEQGLLQEAKALVSEYNEIVKDDIEIYSMQGVIAMMDGDMEVAEEIFKAGLAVDDENFDLLYNLGYLYQSKQENDKAIEFYQRALKNANDESTANGLYEILRGLGVQKSKDSLVRKALPKTSIIILTYNNLEYNKLCIESIRKYTEKETYEIIVVDNHSTDGTVDWLKQQNDLKLILNNKNYGFPKGCNQGIKAAEEGNDILLLNNDTIVTPNWLKNLKKCLYSKDDIGAVGSVTNSCSNLQVIPANYSNLEEMIAFAAKNNVSNSSLWEERLRLVGFCMLIKNEVVKKIGLLDERFTPGNFEDDDFSFRIRKAGYRLILCKDSFIHHFGSTSFKKVSDKYNELLINNRKKFAEKWGFDPYYIIDIDRGITELVSKTGKENIRVLHIGCAGGGTLLDIKNTVPSSELFGIEPVKECIVNVNHFADIRVGDLEAIKTFDKNYFDFIIYTQPQRKESIVEDLLLIKEYLKENGTMYIAITEESVNADRNFIKSLREKIEGYSFKFITVMGRQFLVMEEAGDEGSGSVLKLKVYNKENICKLVANGIPGSGLPDHDAIIKLIRRLDSNIDYDRCLERIGILVEEGKLDSEKVKNIIQKHGTDKIRLFNLMGLLFFQNRFYDKALMLLREALKLDRKNRDTIYNIAFVLHRLNQNEAALGFLNEINYSEKDTEFAQLKHQIEEAL
ncbi:hypothetical protein CDQ85_03715 [Clostridium thermosuccinogenes]|nr:hypothetical protein CDQ85_03715 [Pseudoclostridium thermosuccinogenes]